MKGPLNPPYSRSIAESGTMADHPPLKSFPSASRAWLTLGLLMLAYMVSLIDRQILSLMVDPIKAYLSISDGQIGLLQGFAFALFYCVLGIPLGRYADRANRKHIIIAGLAFWSLMTMLCGWAESFGALFVARVGVGIGEASFGPASYSMLADTFRPSQLVRANAIFAASALIGSALAFLLGGAVIEYVSSMKNGHDALASFAPWQLVFIIVGLPGIFLALIFALFLKEPARLGEHQRLTLGEALAALWIRRGKLVPFYACAVLLGTISYGNLAWAPTHMMRSFGLSPRDVGLILGSMVVFGSVVGSVIVSVLNSRLDRRGSKAPHLATVMIIAMTLVPASAAPLVPSLGLSMAAFTVLFILQSSYFGAITAAIQLITPANVRGMSMAFFFLVVNLASLGIGTTAIGVVSDLLGEGRSSIGIALASVSMAAGLGAVLVAGRAWRSITRERGPVPIVVGG